MSSNVPVRILENFIDNIVESRERDVKNSGLRVDQLVALQKNINETFNDKFRTLNFKELQSTLATYKKEKRIVFNKEQKEEVETVDDSDTESDNSDNEEPVIVEPSNKPIVVPEDGEDSVASKKKFIVKAWNPISDAQSKLKKQLEEEAILLNQNLLHDDAVKYFGDQGKSRFFNRYHWLNQKISKLNTVEGQKSTELWNFEEDTPHDNGEIESRVATSEGYIAMDENELRALLTPKTPKSVRTPHRGLLTGDTVTPHATSITSHTSGNPSSASRTTVATASMTATIAIASPPLTPMSSKSMHSKKSNQKQTSPVKSSAVTDHTGLPFFSEDDEVIESNVISNQLTKPERTELPFSTAASYRKMTARTVYLEGCIRENIAPRAVIIRRTVTNCMILKNQGLGDVKAQLVSESLSSLPYVRSIDFSDNSLTDRGIHNFMTPLIEFKGLLELDLSHNLIGLSSAKAIANYISGSKSNPNSLVRLVLSHTCLSDVAAQIIVQGMLIATEYARITGGASGRSSLKELDISNNKIGYNEVGGINSNSNQNVNSVATSPSRTTTAIALTVGLEDHSKTCSQTIGQLLLHANCSLEALYIGWNVIRQQSASAIVIALSSNKSLKYLDFGFNSIGSDSGIVLGNALLNNATLNHLNLTNNDIDAAACITICQGVIENPAIFTVILDGNPIGEQGAKAVMSVPLCVGYRVRISTNSCNITIKPTDRCWFDYNNVCRSYALKLDDPFDRAISCALLRIVASHDTYIVSKSSYSPTIPKGFINMMQSTMNVKRAGGRGGADAKNARPTGAVDAVNLVQSSKLIDRKLLNRTQLNIISKLEEVIAASSDLDAAVQLFEETDTDGGGTLDSGELMCLLHDLGMMDMTMDQVDAIIVNYDLTGSPSLGLDEFLGFLKDQALRSSIRLNDMTCIPFLALEETPHLKYIPPRTGVLYLDIIPGSTTKKNIPALSAADRISLFEAALESVDHVKMISFAIQGSKLRLEEAQSIYHKLQLDIPQQEKIISMILPYISDTSDAKQFVYYVTNNDYQRLEKLKVTMGNLLRPAFGTPDGFYSLNFKNEMDRSCLSKLLDINAAISRQKMIGVDGKPSNSKRLLNQDGLIGDTSQKGNWSCFRNEFYGDKHVEITADMFVPMPTRGQLEFDFVSGMRPPFDNESIKSTEDSKFLKILGNICIIKNADHSRVLNVLNTMHQKCSACTKHPDGGDGYHARSLHEADQVYIAMDRFYSQLHQRSNNLSVGLQEAEIKFDYMDVLSSLTVMQQDMVKPMNSKDRNAGYEATDSEEDDDDTGKKKSKKRNTTIKGNTNQPARGGSISAPAGPGASSGRLSLANVTKKIVMTNTRQSSIASVALAAAVASRVARRVPGYATGHTPCNQIDVVLNMTKETTPKYCIESDDTDVYTVSKAVEVAPGLNNRAGNRRGNVVLTMPGTGGPDKSKWKNSTVNAMRKSSRKKSDSNDVSVKQMIKRIAYKKLLLHPTVSHHAKASRVLGALMDALSKIWLTSRQLAIIMYLWQQGSIWKAEHFGTYRVELVISMLYRVIDMHNFELVMYYLTTDEIACIYCRLGWLNVYNPMKPEGCYKLNIKSYEDRQLLKMVITLTDIEPGVNFKYASYFRTADAPDPIPGWDLPAGWLTEKTIPNEGLVSFQYYAGGGERLQGCKVMTEFRRSLLQMVALDEREIDREEIDYDPSQPLTVGELTIMNNRQGENIADLWFDYLTISPSVTYFRQIFK